MSAVVANGWVVLLGLVLGGLNVWGLWWSLPALARSSHAALLLPAGFLVRFAVTIVPLLLIAGRVPARWVAGLAGFMIGRWIMVRLIGGTVVGAARPFRGVDV